MLKGDVSMLKLTMKSEYHFEILKILDSLLDSFEIHISQINIQNVSGDWVCMAWVELEDGTGAATNFINLFNETCKTHTVFGCSIKPICCFQEF